MVLVIVMDVSFQVMYLNIRIFKKQWKLLAEFKIIRKFIDYEVQPLYSCLVLQSLCNHQTLKT